MTDSLRMAAHFHDLEVGARLTTSGRTITESDLVGFSSLTGDWHPQHADATWAKQGPFGERIAHGMMIVSYAVGMVPFDPERITALRGLDKVTFKRPVRIGDTIRVVVELTDTKPLDDGHGLARFRWRIINQDGKTACLLNVDALWKIAAISDGADRSETENRTVFL